MLRCHNAIHVVAGREFSVFRVGVLELAGVKGGMTSSAESYQVWFSIIAGTATKSLVMNFEVGHPTAGLASPTIPPQNLLP
jgi:hypothetical protein